MKPDNALFSLHYQLEPAQISEAFRLILDRRGKAARTAVSAILLLLALVLFLWGDRLAPGVEDRLATYAVLLAVLVYGYPGLRARWSTRKLSRKSGWYQLDFYENGTILLPDGSCVPLRGDRASRGYATPRLYALRPDRFHTFCIPRSALSPAQKTQLEELLRTYLGTFHEVNN